MHNFSTDMASYTPPLFQFAWFRDFNAVLEDLRSLASEENWEYQNPPSRRNIILFNYMQHTFQRLKEENKIVKQGKYASFNTGLATPNHEEIFALFKESTMPSAPLPYFFVKFCKESDFDLVKRFDPLPETANYISDPSELIFDTRIRLTVNVDHVIEDNISRFPAFLQSQNIQLLRNVVNGAIEDAKKRIKRNYKTAIPQYFKGQVQLLIPLCLEDANRADLALVVQKMGGIYRASTCLTLDMAINNARLIAKPDDDWLNP